MIPSGGSAGRLGDLAVDAAGPARYSSSAGAGKTPALRAICSSTRRIRYSTSAFRGRSGWPGTSMWIGPVWANRTRPSGRASKQRTATHEEPSIGTAASIGLSYAPRSVLRLAGVIVRATSPLTTTSIRSRGRSLIAEPARRYSRRPASAWVKRCPGSWPSRVTKSIGPVVTKLRPASRPRSQAEASRPPSGWTYTRPKPSGTGWTPEAVPAVGRSRKPQLSRA